MPIGEDTGFQSLNALKVAKAAQPDTLLTLNQIIGVPTVGDALTAIYNPSAIGQNVGSQTLMAKELGYFAKWYYNTFVKPAPSGYLREFFDSKFTVGLIGLLHAKQNVGNKGIYGGPGATLHTQAIRPVTATASGINGGTTPQETWLVSSVNAGWTESYFVLDMTKTGAGTLNLLNNVEMITFGLFDFNVSPKLLEFQFLENGNKPLGVISEPLNLAPNNDGMAIDLSVESYIVPVNTKYTIDVNFASSGATATGIVGIQYVSDVYVSQE
jgi:hypothetical protein